MRWQLSLKDGANPVDEADRLMATVTALGWAGEAVKLIRYGAKKGLLRRDMISHSDELLQTWEACGLETIDPAVKIALKVRNKCFAHWDPDVAKAFLATQQDEENRAAFIESDARGQFLRTRYPWAQAAIAHLIIGTTEDVDEMRLILRPLIRFAPSLSHLVSVLAKAMITEMGLSFEKVNE